MSAVRFYLAELVAALHAMHDVNVCHRDIKPDNVLIDAEGHVVVTDLGLAIEFKPQDPWHQSHFWGQCGSYGYRAPEVVLDDFCGPHSDVYSLGATTYFLLYGKPPWSQTKLGLEGEPLVFPSNPAISQEFISLIVRMLAFDAKDRITLDEIQQHTVYAGVKWDLVYQKSKKSGLGKPPFIPDPDSFEFPNFTPGTLKNSGPAKELTPDQQAAFEGFEWVPGDPLYTAGTFEGHFSRSNSRNDFNKTPSQTTLDTLQVPSGSGKGGSGSMQTGTKTGDEPRSSYDETKDLPMPEADELQGKSLPPAVLGASPETRAEIAIQAEAALKSPAPSLLAEAPSTPRKPGPGALSPLVPGHRMKLKHLRNLKELGNNNKGKQPPRPPAPPRPIKRDTKSEAGDSMQSRGHTATP